MVGRLSWPPFSSMLYHFQELIVAFLVSHGEPGQKNGGKWESGRVFDFCVMLCRDKVFPLHSSNPKMKPGRSSFISLVGRNYVIVNINNPPSQNRCPTNLTNPPSHQYI